ncbi:thiosulfate ABC transporter substrate-binding protein CysP [Pelagibacterium lentulum]|uniref:Thiosulfate transporter subunit n=1 Tax=Pelagibacterium lentulum TaxID=2029865 RepID=A0A916W288_9HYPH|nr:thiosulfate ABC transporter substrate-binding protein CysP [Pelagibacterium lentulum]GGA61195.1 thiosulfate transporter subunit [Pelagibacterium lentulum]
MKKLVLASVLALGLGAPAVQAQPTTLLNVSYDIARELFAAVNEAFVPYYEEQTGIALSIEQSHAGTSAQARAIIEGLEADVVTFNQATDIELLEVNGLVGEDWRERLPNNASPYYSLPAFLVRAGNPKNIQDWDDLVRDDVEVIFPNPKTSGNARYTYLAARAYAEEVFGGDQAQVEDYLRNVFLSVPGFPTGGRAATTAFVEQGIGDVLITFESEVNNIRDEFGTGVVEAVVPSVSLKADFPVAVVDAVVDARGSRDIAEDYLEFLYTPEGQDIVASFYYRVTNEDVAAAYADMLPDVRLFDPAEVFGTWDEITTEHFAEGGLLDQVFVNQ